MKHYLLIIILFLFSLQAEAQNTKSSDAKSLKQKKMIVALKEYPKKASEEMKLLIDSSNASLKFAMQNYWTFSEVVEFMPISEAKDFIKENKESHSYVAIELGISKSTKKAENDNIRGNAYRYVSYSERIGIYAPSLISSTFLPHYEGPLTKAAAVFAVIQMQKVLELLYQEEFTSMMGSRSYVKNNGQKIKSKTLLIPKEYISDDLTTEEIREAYPFDLEICDLQKIEKAILDRDAKYAVMYHVPIPIGGKFLYRLYISSAEDGDVYGTADGGKVYLDLGIFGDTSKKSYLIRDKELKQIAKITE